MTSQLIYWPLPFRGNFIRLTLELTGDDYADTGFKDVIAWKNQPAQSKELPTLAPPYFIDQHDGLAYGQMPMIMQHLAEKHSLLPEDPYHQKLCLKMMLDASDILLEITRHHGMTMWHQDDWHDFRSQRLPLWMQIFEQTYLKYGRPGAPFFFGNRLTQADIIVYGLWGTMTTRLPQLRADLTQHAPEMARLSDRIAEQPAIAAFETRQQHELGSLYCGGEIEKSLRAMLKGDMH